MYTVAVRDKFIWLSDVYDMDSLTMVHVDNINISFYLYILSHCASYLPRYVGHVWLWVRSSLPRSLRSIVRPYLPMAAFPRGKGRPIE